MFLGSTFVYDLSPHVLSRFCLFRRSPSGQWGDAFPVATAKAGFTRFLCLVFTGQEAFPLMAGGVKAVSFFGHTDGSRGLRRKRGVFG